MDQSQWMTDYRGTVSPGMAGQLHISTHSCCDSMNKACARQSQTKSEHIDQSQTQNPTPSPEAIGNYQMIE